MVAEELAIDFCYTEPTAPRSSETLFPVQYRLTSSIAKEIKGRHVAIVNDVINAGSAVRGSFEELSTAGATVAVISSLLVLGDTAETFSRANGIPLEHLARLPNEIWHPDVCPMCAKKVPLTISD